MYKSTLIFLLLIFQAVLLGCSGKDYDPTSQWSAKNFYEEARTALDAGEFQTAIKHLETLEARFPFDPYAKQAQLDVAYSYYKFDEPESAISAINRFMRLHPRDPHIDYVYYLKGLINFNRGRGILDGWFPRDVAKHDPQVLTNAFNDFSTLVRRFPDSQYAGDAHQRMIYLRNKMAQHEIETAEFYIERGTWLAAANRAKQVIERYQESAWRQRALEIMLESYRELGLKELAADTQRIMELNPSAQSAPETSEPNDALDTPPEIAG